MRHHPRSGKIGHALLRSLAVKAVRDVLAENTKIDPWNMSSTMKDTLFKAARLTARGVTPASIKASKPYGKLRGKLQGLLASHNSTYNAEYYRYVEAAAAQSAVPIFRHLSHLGTPSRHDRGPA